MAMMEDPEAHSRLSTIAYYHFDRIEDRQTSPEAAFRSIATQLLQSHLHDHSTLDLTCLLLRRTSLRSHFTFEEVLDTISLLLQQHPTYLIVDGIDDCADLESFLKSLARICRVSDVRVILFSSPQIRIPLEYQKWASDAPHILTLTHERNLAAIESYTLQHLANMADRGYFGMQFDRHLLLRVARAADGNFLWAKLVLKFFGSSLLTAEERHAILQNIEALTGLNNLYCNMLVVFERLPEKEKHIIGNAFRWLSCSVKSLDPSALYIAITSHITSSLQCVKSTYRTESLSVLSLDLLHTMNDTVTFTHPSFRRYLHSAASAGSQFSLYDESLTHAYLAAQCLSYLARNMPKQPLGVLQPESPTIPATQAVDSGASLRTSKSGDSGYKSLSSSDGDNIAVAPPLPEPETDQNGDTSTEPPPFDVHLPFLRYASLCWPIHLSRSLALHDSSTAPAYPFIPDLSAFLSNRLAVTTWVEASFRYNLPPTLTRLVGPLADLKGELSPTTPQGRDLRIVVGQMRELSERLMELKRDYEAVLRRNASLIWQMDSVRGGREDFWVVWEDVVMQ